MKKMKWLVLPLFSLALATPIFTSCSEDDETPVEELIPPGHNPDTLLTIDEQKRQLEATGKKFVEEIKASDFQNVADLARYIKNTYKNYNDDAIEDWADDCLDAITSSVVDTEESYGDIYNYYNRIYVASKYKGHFKAENGRWICTNASAGDLQFMVKDQNGQDCVVKLTASGNTKRIFIGEDWDEFYLGYDYYYGSQYKYEIYNEYVDIPEVATVTMTQGGNVLATLTINTPVLSIESDEFDPETDKFDVSATMKVNGYEWKIERAQFDGSSSATAKMGIYKNGAALLTVTASAEGNVGNEEARNLNLNIDVLGEVQIKGNCSEVNALIDKMEAADRNDENEGNFKSYINQANELLDLGVYYHGSETKQAYLKFEPFEDSYYYYGNRYSEWYAEPVICFSDGTSYSTFEAFFDEGSFRGVINALETLINNFENL